jgi:hypothetical protein
MSKDGSQAKRSGSGGQITPQEAIASEPHGFDVPGVHDNRGAAQLPDANLATLGGRPTRDLAGETPHD